MKAIATGVPGLLLACVLGVVAPGAAQAQTVVNVGILTTTQSCQYFREYEGNTRIDARASAAAVATRRGAAAASASYSYENSWRSWIVEDCEDNFPNLRQSLEAAIASTGVLLTGPDGHVVDVTISDISENWNGVSNASGSTGQSTATATVSFTVYDPSGASIHGGVLTKEIELSFSQSSRDTSAVSVQSGEAAYDRIQQEVALAIARSVAFAVEPMIVLRSDSTQIEVNYGAPLLEMNSILQVERTRGIGTVQYRVTNAGRGISVAELACRGTNTSDIGPGNIVTFIESDSNAANARTCRGGDLPR